MAVSYSDQQSVVVGHNVSLADEVSLGTNITIGNNVTIYPGVIIGDNCHIFDGAVIGRPPKSTGNITRPIDPALRTLELGADSIVGANAVLYTGSTFGARTLIGDLASIREGCTLADDVVIGRGVMVMYATRVGARTRVIDGAVLTGNMLIEEDVFIGPGAMSVNDNEVYLKRFGLQPFEAVGPVIRRFALIGTGANLSAGIEIGMGAIVAPSAMVTSDVPAWMIVAGVPAKPLRPVDEHIRTQILTHFGL